ncbi:MAG TPA: dihydrodipicolinate synthase family protein [Atribacteraceae bacterium]|nr:dihydrodipicolinate synthase family protein [Atribacteraceae bacterium]
MRLLEGVVVAHATPFDEKDHIDYTALQRYIHFLAEKQVDGMFVCGTTAEAQILSMEERKSILETALKANDGKMTITAQCGTSNLTETHDLLDHARTHGADGAAVVTPFYYVYTQEELFDYYASIAREFSDFPLYLYNIPQLTNNNLAVSTVSRLAEQFSNLVGIKDSSGNFSTVTGYILESRPDFRVILGYDRAFFVSLMSGGSGSVTGPGGVVPEPFVDVWRAYREKDYEKARDLQRKLIKISAAMGEGTNFAMVKAALSLRGFGNGKMRRPFHSLPEQAIQALRDRLKKALEETGYLIPELTS